jgi:dihydroxy-acid dehydratase
LGLVRTGDRIRLDVPARTLELLVDDAELEKRKADFQPPYHEGQERGYLKLYLDEVTQADTGADFAFLRAVKK